MQIESAGCTFVRETESLGESWLRHPTSKPYTKCEERYMGSTINGKGCLQGSVHNLSIDPLIQAWSEWVWVFSSQTTDGLGIFHREVLCFVAQITNFSWLKIPVTKKHRVKIVTPGLFIVYEISGGSPHDLVIFIHIPLNFHNLDIRTAVALASAYCLHRPPVPWLGKLKLGTPFLLPSRMWESL